MAKTTKNRKSRFVNPIEAAIFALTLGFFLHSAYRLFLDHEANSVQMAAQQSHREVNRSPATMEAPQAYTTIDIDCSDHKDYSTDADRVRLSGKICGKGTLKRAEIINRATRAEAVIFLDQMEGSYLTDYMNLSNGKNPFELRFFFSDSKDTGPIRKEIVLNKSH